MATDLLTDAAWECAYLPPGLVEHPDQLHETQLTWLAANVPGTAAGALRAAEDWSWGVEDEQLLDGSDWWFRTGFEALDATEHGWELSLGGLATIADVWLNGVHLLHSENMFLAHRLPVEYLQEHNELALHLAALSPLFSARHPRPRFKSRLVRYQGQRWYRTTLLGRAPGWSRWAAPVGPWRAAELHPITDKPELLESQLHCECDGDGGRVTIKALVRCAAGAPAEATIAVGGERTSLELTPYGEHLQASATVHLEQVERWWPHTHGAQPRYSVTLEFDGVALEAGSVGFRTLELDQSNGAFILRVNDVQIFCRGACWGPPDAVSLNCATEELRQALRMVRDAGMNMLRVPGYGLYESRDFWEACDELGILVWQDCMFASVDPPEEPDFLKELETELRQVLAGIAGRPSLAVVCGSSETYQQGSMLGLPADRWRSDVLERTIPEIVGEILPRVPYVPSTPIGGGLPFDTGAGVTHYFGVGAYMRPLSDARLANVRFAAECLSFATPPEPETVEQVFGSAQVAGHEPRWKASVPRDAGMSWDFEDIRDHYVKEIFSLDPLQVRYDDPEWALDLGRAAIVEAMSHVLGDWRRKDSPCAGALVLTLRDLWPGPGWGLIDALGRPKAPWYALARIFAARAITITDEGLSGLYVHVFNDRPEPLSAAARLSVFDHAGELVESARRELSIAPHDALVLADHELLGGFRDLAGAYRFSPSVYDVVLAELEDEHGQVIARAFHLPAGARRARFAEIGLGALVAPAKDGAWELEISSRAFAQYVALDIPGFTVSDSWFHLAPGQSSRIRLQGADPQRSPSGTVRALNSRQSVRVSAGESP